MERNNTALTGIKKMIADGIVTQEAAEKYFPELKESKDEKIRKEIINFIKISKPEWENYSDYSSWIAWLEKQGDNPTPINIDKMVMEYSQTKDSDFGLPVNCMIRAYRQGIIDVLNLSSGIEKQGEQKPADKYNIRGIKSKYAEGKLGEMIKNLKSTDKIEPKFKAGDKIIGIVSGIQYYISKVCNDYYFTETGACIMFNAQNNFKLYEQKSTEWSEDDKSIALGIEKQGEQNHANSTKTCEDEQKSIDKVEPKFHKGQWIACEELNTAKIVNIDDDKYEVEFIEGNKGFPHIDYVDRNFHLYTIQDAKDGDVLVDKSGNRECPFIFKETKQSNIKTDMMNPLTVLGYCGIGGAGFTKGSGWGDTANCIYYPATKEQRDTLMKAIADAGWDFDFEKKELKKIKQGNSPVLSNSSNVGKKEQKSADKTESIVHNYITPNPQFFQWIYNRLIHIHNENPSMDYMLSLKERVEDMQKSAWSVEDEDMLDNIIDDYDDADEHNLVDDIGKVMWLKSIKQRMKG